MDYVYRTSGTCSAAIKFKIDGNIITDVEFIGGCPGNLAAVGRLVNGMTVEEIESKLGGIRCGGKPTSCPDQLARAVREAAGRVAGGSDFGGRDFSITIPTH